MRKHRRYEHTFFRRPILTADNIRFWWILGLVGILLVITVLQSMSWVDRLPSQVVATQIKKKYISFLSRQQLKLPQPEKVELRRENLVESVPELDVDIGKKVQSSLSQVAQGRSAYRELLDESKKPVNWSRPLSLTEGDAVEPITAVVESVPGLIVAPSFVGRSEKSLSLQNEEEILRRYDRPINIPEPEVFRFSSQNGNRDLFETTAIMEVNEVDIRFCFEKFARFDPTFSGDVLVSFTIHPEGYVIPSSIKIVKSNIKDPRILRCIKKSIQRWKNFPRIALEDGVLTITRKYVF